jgi:hypothetical protein
MSLELNLALVVILSGCSTGLLKSTRATVPLAC